MFDVGYSSQTFLATLEKYSSTLINLQEIWIYTCLQFLLYHHLYSQITTTTSWDFRKRDIDMYKNFLLQYDQVVEYVQGYRSSFNKMAVRHQKKSIKDQGKNFKTYWSWFNQIDPMSDKMPEAYINDILKYATEEEKQDPYIQVLLSKYPLDTLATVVLQKFPDLDYVKLKQINELKKEQLERTNLAPRIIGPILALSTILLGQVPESVVARVVDYAVYELVVFLSVLGTISYLLIILYPLWVKHNRARTLLGYIGALLTYITIIKQEDKTN
jgi:hypothetical protein